MPNKKLEQLFIKMKNEWKLNMTNQNIEEKCCGASDSPPFDVFFLVISSKYSVTLPSPDHL